MTNLVATPVQRRSSLKLLTLFVLGSSAPGAQAVTLSSTGTMPCRGCSLTIDSITTLGQTEQPGQFFAREAFSAVIVNGRVLVSSTAPIQMFDLNARFLGLLGRQGQGPGEFPTWLTGISLGPSKRIHAFAGQQVVVFDSSSGFLRAVTLGRGSQVPTVLSDGRYAGLARLPAGGRASSTAPNYAQSFQSPLFHLFDSTGLFVRSAGTMLSHADQLISAGERGTVWTGKRAPYEMKQWSRDGLLLRTIERVTPWFDRTPYNPFSSDADGRPRSELRRLFQDARGRLWTSVSIAKLPSSRGSVAAASCCDSLIEVIDPASGALIASARVPHFVNSILEDGYIAATASGIGGEPLLVLYRARLAGGVTNRQNDAIISP